MAQEKASGGRLDSLDALRGFDMLWIAGGDMLLSALRDITGWRSLHWATEQMEHVPWEGFHFYDLIFPMFLFISGVTIPLAVARRRARGESSTSLFVRFTRRALLLVFLGMVYNGFFNFDWPNMRYASVLSRIGLGYYFAALIVTHASPRIQSIVTAVILLGYWAIVALVPVPGIGAGVITPEGSIVGYVDRLLLPGKLWFTVYDPEGILSTIPAVATALLGALTGHMLMRTDTGQWKKAITMAGAGVILLLLGNLWGMVFPIIKNIWTSSFVLVTAGWSLILLSVFYAIMDILGWKKWAFVFVLIGVNPLTLYLTQAGMINYDGTVNYFLGGILRIIGTPWGPFWFAAALLALKLGFLYILYRNKIFLRV
jgi:predicted acyltransferase